MSNDSILNNFIKVSTVYKDSSSNDWIVWSKEFYINPNHIVTVSELLDASKNQVFVEGQKVYYLSLVTDSFDCEPLKCFGVV